jgi:AraC-like DNA-binding protein
MEAKDLLAHTDKGISEIGEIVGFVSSAHFSHVFKKSEGCTPSDYRMNHRTYWEKKENCEEDVS